MGAITGTKIEKTPTEFAGEVKIVCLTATIASSSDTITISSASHGISTIVGVVGNITAGQDAAFTAISVSHSSTVITITSVEEDGTAATDFTGTTVELWVLGY